MDERLHAAALTRLNAAGLGEARVLRVLVDLPERSCLELRLGDRRCVLKLQRERAVADREVLALRSAAASHLRVPPVLWCEHGEASLLLLEWIDGTPLEGAASGWAAAGRALRRLHALEPPRGLPSYSEGQPWRDFWLAWAAREARLCAEMGALGPAEAAAVERWLRERLAELPEPRPSFLHGDLQPAHVLVTGDAATLLDWGDAGTGDPLWDLAVLLLDHPARLPELLAGYRPSPAFQAHTAVYFDAYRAARYLAEITWLVERGFDPAASVRGLRALA